MPRPKPPPEPAQQWPPRSPHEALVSTPEGRKKYRQMLERSPSHQRSPSQMSSPSRRLLFGSPSRPLASSAAGGQMMMSPTRSVRPSPAAKAMSALSARAGQGAGAGARFAAGAGGEDADIFDYDGDGFGEEGEEEDDDEDEDEETLRLKLEAIQAKLKLKKLMNAKKKKAGEANAAASHSGSGSGSSRTGTPAPIRARTLIGTTEGTQPVGVFGGLGGGLQDAPSIIRQHTSLQPSTTSALARAKSIREAAINNSKREQEHASEIQVPASPAKEPVPPRPPPVSGYNNHNHQYGRATSPIRPPQTSLATATLATAATGAAGRAGMLDSRASTHTNNSSSSSFFQPQQKYLERRSQTPSSANAEPSGDRGKEQKQSFAERLAAARHEEDDRREKERRVKASRTDTFGISKREMDEFKAKPVAIEAQVTAGAATGGKDAGPSFSREEILGLAAGKRPKPNKSSQAREDGEDGAESEGLEPYSSVHLKTRILPHQTLTRTLENKKIFLLQDLLKDVKAPDFELPDVEADIVVMGVIASKSDPRDHKNNESKSNKGKFMVITVTDLTYEIDLFLFASGFTRFWRVPTGTLVAILNPGIMPPPPGKADTGRFSLVVNSDADIILEVGTARDLGYCGAKRKDGKMCSSWVNLRRTEFCEFHMNEAVKKKRTGRMEVNSMDGWSSGAISGGRGGGRGGGGRGGGKGSYYGGEEREKYKPNAGPKDYDRETHTKYFISRSGASSAAGLLDKEESSFADRKEREEHLKKRLVREEKERDVARKLAQIGGGRAGSEYLGAAVAGVEGSLPAAPSTSTRKASEKGSGFGCGGGRGEKEGEVEEEEINPFSARAMGMIPVQGSTDLTLKRKRPVDIMGSLSSSSSISRTRTTTATSSSTSTSTSTAAYGHNSSSNSKKPATALGWGSNLKSQLSKMKDGGTLMAPSQAQIRRDLKAQGQKQLNFPSPTHPPPPPTTTTTTTTTSTTATTTNTGSDGRQQQQQQQQNTIMQSQRKEKEEEEEDTQHHHQQEGPVRKKTRFLTDAGIKEAGGRDSVGVAAAAVLATVVGDGDQLLSSDDDDDLVII